MSYIAWLVIIMYAALFLAVGCIAHMVVYGFRIIFQKGASVEIHACSDENHVPVDLQKFVRPRQRFPKRSLFLLLGSFLVWYLALGLLRGKMIVDSPAYKKRHGIQTGRFDPAALRNPGNESSVIDSK